MEVRGIMSFLGEKKRLQPRPASGINNPPIPPIPPTIEKARFRFL